MTADDSPEQDADDARGRDPIAALWSAATVRARCAQILHAVEDGRSGWCRVQREPLAELAARVAAAIDGTGGVDAAASPRLWHRVTAAGSDRVAELERRLQGRDRAAIARAQIDLTVVGVLLDLSPAARWQYEENEGHRTDELALPAERQRREDLLALLDRASGTSPAMPGASSTTAHEEAPIARGTRQSTGAAGVAIAIWHAFNDGVFSADADDPLRADARVLSRLDSAALRAVFQCAPGQSMPGLDARAEVLRQLGTLLERASPADGRQARPAHVFDRWLDGRGDLDAASLLGALARSWAAAWTRGGRVLGLPAGDAWPHRWAGARTGCGAGAAQDGATAGWVPLHLPLQRVVRDVAEPLRRAGLRVVNLEALTAPTDTESCGLLLDSGVIVPREPRDLQRTWEAGDEFVVELRALCVPLFDELARQVRERLGLGEQDLPLAAVLDATHRCASERDLPRLSIDPASALP